MHGWYLPVYSLVFLCFSRSDDTFSLDALIRRRWPSWPGASSSSWPLSRSGFGRKLVLLAAVHMLFSGGLAKLVSGGLAWADGRSLQSYILLTSEVFGSQPRYPLLASWLSSSVPLATLGAVSTLALELGSPIALFSRRWRHVITLGALFFHAAIFMTMLPDFSAQAWCYILIVDWAALWGLPRAGLQRVYRTSVDGRTTVAVVCACLLAAVFLGVGVLQIERWPLTNVPMYSSYVSGTRVSGIARSDYETNQGLARLVDLDQNHQLPWVSRWLFWRQTDVVLSGNGEEALSVKIAAMRSPLPPPRYTWVFLLGDLVPQELRRKLKGGGAPAGALDTDTILRILAQRAAAQGIPVEKYRTVDLVCRLRSESVVLVSVYLTRSTK